MQISHCQGMQFNTRRVKGGLYVTRPCYHHQATQEDLEAAQDESVRRSRGAYESSHVWRPKKSSCNIGFRMFGLRHFMRFIVY